MRILFYLTLIHVVLTQDVHAQEEPQPYAFLFIAKDLPDKRIQTIAQDSRGFVWIATFNGLFRYDGLRYKIFKNTPGIVDQISFNHIGQMFIHQDRFMIIESEREVNILDLQTEKVIYKSPPGLLFKQTLARKEVCYFHFEDPDLNSYFFKFNENGQPDSIPNFLHAGMRMDNATLVGNGQIVFFDKSGWLWKADPSQKTITPFDTISYSGRRLLYLPDLYCDASGHLWAFDNAQPEYNGMYILDSGKPVKAGELFNRQTLIPQPDQNKFWIYGIDTKLLSEFDIQSKRITPVMSLPDEVSNIRSIMRDRQQNLWVGSQYINHNGILLVHPHITAFQKFMYQKGKERSIGLACRGLTELKTGEIVVGGRDGIYMWNPKNNEVRPEGIKTPSKEIEITNIWKIIADPDGHHMWFTKEEGGIFRYDLKTKQSVNFLNHGEISNRSLGMMFDDRGMIWIGTRSGISMFERKTETYIKAPESLKQFYNISGYDWVHIDQELWLCSSKGLFVFDKNTYQPVRKYTTDTEPFLYSNEVFDIVKDGDVYWIATDNGLHKLEHQKITRYTTEQGLAHDVVASLAMDEDHNLWIATFDGLSKMNILTGEFQNFYVEDGLPHNEFNRLGKLKGSDGQLYFSGQNGVLHFNPKSVTKEVPEYELVLTGFSTFDQKGLLQKKNVAELQLEETIQIPAGNKYFQVEFALLNFINPGNNRYSYYLEGLEETWRPLSTLPFVQYNNLPSGKYTLHIKAETPSGHQSQNTLDLNLIVSKHFYQTALFRILLLVTIFSFAFGILRYRFLQQLKMEQMRNRISSDLHDEVGGVLSGIAMQMDLLETRSPDPLKPFMQRIAESSRTAAMKMRDVIWSLDSSKDHVQDLVDRMKAYTLEALVPFDIVHRFETIDIDPLQVLSVEARQNIYLIFKEAINNIIKHAQATTVDIKLEGKKNMMVMTIMDNGRGFSLAIVSKGQGLGNMEKRTRRINGKLEIHPGKEHGTLVVLRMPT
ncbi:MAG TPA: two-component regulator propeller domain-containing protein [Saprospiraceae bacterium]